MADLAGVKPGDTLVMSGVNMRGRQEEVTVSRVGRLYLYVTRYGRESKFSIETGVAADRYGHEHLRTPQQVADDARRSALLIEIAELGFRPVEFRATRLTIPQLERVATALRAD